MDYAVSAIALLVEERVFLQAYLPTTAGLSIAAGPVRSAQTNSVDRLSEAIRSTFELPLKTLGHPSQSAWRDIQAPMLKAAGFKSWSAMARRSKAVGIERNDTVIRMTPTANYANDGGQDLAEAVIDHLLNDEGSGAALLEAFKRSS